MKKKFYIPKMIEYAKLKRQIAMLCDKKLQDKMIRKYGK